MHTHSDFTLMVNGRAESQVHQGVTTEVVGQCGISCAPVNSDQDIKQMAIGYCENSHKLGWRSFKDYLSSLEKNKLGVNVAAFVGHGAVHNNVLGNELRAPNNDEIIKMCKIIEESLDEGAAGFSSGLEYWPGNLATSQDLVSMCEKVAKRNKIYATHVTRSFTPLLLSHFHLHCVKYHFLKESKLNTISTVSYTHLRAHET